MAVEAPIEELEQTIEYEYQRSRLRSAAEQIRHEFKEQSWRAFWITTLEGTSVTDAAKQLAMSTGAVYAARSRIMRRMQDFAATCDPLEEE